MIWGSFIIASSDAIRRLPEGQGENKVVGLQNPMMLTSRKRRFASRGTPKALRARKAKTPCAWKPSGANDAVPHSSRASMSTKVSPLAPKTYVKLPPIEGVRIATAEAGIKYKNRTDLLMMVF